MNSWFDSFLSLFFPRCCVVCGNALAKGEEVFCTRCNIGMPRTELHKRKDNILEQLFFGKIPIERAASYFYYHKGSPYRLILYQLKYYGKKEVGEVMGRYITAELLPSGFFDGIDVIVPVPLHKKKKRLRGYNQSEWIAYGVSKLTGLPIDVESVIRIKNTETQTHKNASERLENVENIFQLYYPERFTGKHVLIIDDVLTTGATITACASAFKEVAGIRFSVLTLAAVGKV